MQGNNPANHLTDEYSSPPPSYTTSPPPQQPSVDGKDHVIDPPDLTAGFRNLSLPATSARVPQVNHRLRRTVVATDGLFGVSDAQFLNHLPPETRASSTDAELLSRLGEKRWTIYVTRAVKRFERWWFALDPGVA